MAWAHPGNHVIILPPIYMDSPFMLPQAMPYVCGPAPLPFPCGFPPQQPEVKGRPGSTEGVHGAYRGGSTKRGTHSTVRHPSRIEAASRVPDHARTTVMLKNLPCEYTRAMLLELMDAEGFEGLYDFVYLPIDFQSKLCFGYGFVNLTTRTHAARFWRQFQGFTRWALPTRKVAEVTWSDPLQGLEAHRERYRDSPLMHESVPDEYKPVLLVGGQRIDFDPPTKKIKAPRVRCPQAMPAVSEESPYYG